jgi:uncharacterized membrane protein
MPSSAQKRDRRPHWYWIIPRVLLVTFILTALTFAVSLLLGIVGIVIAARLRGIHPNMAFAYRHIAAPTAAVAGCVVLILAATMEVRHYRQSRTLAAIERTAARDAV